MTRPVRTGGFGLVLARIATLGIGALAAGLTARALGPIEFGVYAAGVSVVLACAALGSLGIDQLYMNGRIDDTELVRASGWVALLALVLGIALSAGWPNLTTESRLVGVVVSLATALGVWRMHWTLFPGTRLAFSLRARRELGAATATAAATVLGAVWTRQPLGAAAGFAVSSAVLVIWAARESPTSRERRVHVAGVLRAGVPFAVAGAIYTVYSTVDAAILAAYRPALEVGNYRAAYTFIVAAVAIAVAINNDVLRPHLLQARPRQGALSFLHINLVCGLGLSAAMVLLSDPLVTLAFGEDFASSGELLRALSFMVPLFFLNAYFANRFIFAGLVRAVLYTQATMLAVNVALNLALIPSRGAMGSAYATVATEAIGLALYAVLAWRVRLEPR